jgi:hypothetical protein
MGQHGDSVTEFGSTSFGYIIGFLLPGFLGLYALGLWFQDLQKFLQLVISPTATIGPSSFVLLASLTVGVIVSALRFYIFQQWLCGKHVLNKELFQNLAGDSLEAFRAVADEHYRYHQFYGGCAIVLLGLFPRWLWINWSCPVQWQQIILICVFLILETVLVLAAMNSFKLYVDRGNKIIAGKRTGNQET